MLPLLELPLLVVNGLFTGIVQEWLSLNVGGLFPSRYLDQLTPSTLFSTSPNIVKFGTRRLWWHCISAPVSRTLKVPIHWSFFHSLAEDTDGLTAGACHARLESGSVGCGIGLGEA